MSKHYHGLTVETLSNMPELLAKPVFLYDSLGTNKSNDAAIIAVTDQKDKEENPIVIIVRPNSKGQLEADTVDSNFVATMYGHDNINRQIEEAIRQDKLLFIDKNKSQTLSPFAGLQLSRALDNSDSNGIVHPSRIIVNESQTWLGKEFPKELGKEIPKEISEQTHDNNIEKEKTFFQTQKNSSYTDERRENKRLADSLKEEINQAINSDSCELKLSKKKQI